MIAFTPETGSPADRRRRPHAVPRRRDAARHVVPGRVAAAFLLVIAAILSAGASAPIAAAATPSPSPSPSPSPRPTGFAIADGATFSKRLFVKIGDGGTTPFFRPAVCVWSGGSISGGSGASAELSFSAQTLRLVPHVARVYHSKWGSAMLADMIARAAETIDVHYDAAADLNLCVVLGGAADLREGATVESTYDSLRQFCRDRRTAGFRVLVCTLLPSVNGISYEPARALYNARLRTTWAEFADGIVDIAADPRIGDPGDNFDLRFYSPDGLHPNASGYAVMGEIAAATVNSLDWRSDHCETRIGLSDDAWTEWGPYVPDRMWTLTPGEGARSLTLEYRIDGGPETVAVADSIFVDTVAPIPTAPVVVKVRRHCSARIPFAITDALPTSGSANGSVRIANRSGQIVKILRFRSRPVNQDETVRFVCSLPRGSYTLSVHARDVAGNLALVPAVNRLVVK